MSFVGDHLPLRAESLIVPAGAALSEIGVVLSVTGAVFTASFPLDGIARVVA
jgi:hypothetical protein